MKLDWKTCFRVCASLFGLYLCIFYWEAVSGMIGTFLRALSPLLVGLVMAYVLNILMSFYEKHYFPRQANKTWVSRSRPPFCLLASIITLMGIVALVIDLVVPELVSCVKILLTAVEPALDQLLQSKWATQLLPAEILSQLDAVNFSETIEKAIRVVLSGLGSAAGAVVSTVSSVVSSTVDFFLSAIFAIYLLLSRDQLQRQSRRLLRCFLPARLMEKLTHWLQVFNDCFHRFIVGQCVEAVILGVLCMLGMTLFGFPYAMMIGSLIGFTALIPIAGAYIGAGVGAVMILTESPLKALLFLVFIVVLQQLEGNLIYPRVVGNSIGLPALWVLAAITVGGSLMGITGMLIGVPIAAALYRLLREELHRLERAEATGSPKPQA